MKNKIKVGDILEIEQAWEDMAGNYHNEIAEVLNIDKDGFMKLKFNTSEITEWLKDTEFHIDDYQDSIQNNN